MGFALTDEVLLTELFTIESECVRELQESSSLALT